MTTARYLSWAIDGGELDREIYLSGIHPLLAESELQLEQLEEEAVGVQDDSSDDDSVDSIDLMDLDLDIKFLHDEGDLFSLGYDFDLEPKDILASEKQGETAEEIVAPAEEPLPDLAALDEPSEPEEPPQGRGPLVETSTPPEEDVAPPLVSSEDTEDPQEHPQEDPQEHPQEHPQKDPQKDPQEDVLPDELMVFETLPPMPPLTPAPTVRPVKMVLLMPTLTPAPSLVFTGPESSLDTKSEDDSSSLCCRECVASGGGGGSSSSSSSSGGSSGSSACSSPSSNSDYDSQCLSRCSGLCSIETQPWTPVSSECSRSEVWDTMVDLVVPATPDSAAARPKARQTRRKPRRQLENKPLRTYAKGSNLPPSPPPSPSDLPPAAGPGRRRTGFRRTGDCSVCGLFFMRLDKHMMSHNDERPHVCPVCMQAFRQSEHLRRHQQSHSETRDPSRVFICPVAGCEKKLSRKDKLADHMRINHGPGKKATAVSVCSNRKRHQPLKSIVN